jgi:hypothetical protein
VSKEAYGPQYSHPPIQFGLRNCFKLLNLKSRLELFSPINFENPCIYCSKIPLYRKHFRSSLRGCACRSIFGLRCHARAHKIKMNMHINLLFSACDHATAGPASLPGPWSTPPGSATAQSTTLSTQPKC